MNNTNPLVSVIVPTYGRCDYLSRTVNSVLNQSFYNIEVIVVDDNGIATEQGRNTNAVMAEFKQNPSVIYIRHESNRNGSAARNSGLEVARGDFIALLDDDDEFHHLKIETQLDFLNHHTEFGAVYCLNSKYYKGKLVQTTEYIKSGNCQYDVLCLKSDIHTSSILIRKECIMALSGFDEEFLRHQDYEFLVRFFEKYHIGCIPEVLVNIHIESEINRPNVNKLIEAKRLYFIKLEDIISKYSDADKKYIFKAHDFELFRVCIKNNDRRAFKYLSRLGFNYSDFVDFILPVALRTFRKIF